MKVIVGFKIDIAGEWEIINRECFTIKANLRYKFVCARIMRSTLDSVVTKKKALLIYATLKGMKINVGKIINEEIHALAKSSTMQVLGFPHLIYGLY